MMSYQLLYTAIIHYIFPKSSNWDTLHSKIQCQGSSAPPPNDECQGDSRRQGRCAFRKVPGVPEAWVLAVVVPGCVTQGVCGRHRACSLPSMLNFSCKSDCVSLGRGTIQPSCSPSQSFQVVGPESWRDPSRSGLSMAVPRLSSHPARAAGKASQYLHASLDA